MQKLRVKRVKLRIEMDKTQGQISENSGSKLKNSGFGISPNLVKFSRTAQKKSLYKACQHDIHKNGKVEKRGNNSGN